MKDIKQILAKNLKKIRKEKNLTQEKLAELAHIKFRTIGFIEQAKYFGSADTINKIINALEISSTDLYRDDEIVADDIVKTKIDKITNILYDYDPTKLEAIQKVIVALKDAI